MTQLAMVFPGQGSQSVGMLDAYLAEFEVARQTVDEANAVLGFDLGAMIQDGPAEVLNATENTQVAMLTADIAIWRCYRALGGPAPVVMAGHSLGEYAALVAAGVLAFTDAVKVVRQRAEWMQAAVPQGAGAMAAVIGLDDAAVAALCREYAQDQVLEPVNFNAPGQVVIAGDAAAVERAVSGAKGFGARMAKALPVSVPAHSALMRPVADKMSDLLAQQNYSRADTPVIQNVDADVHNDVDSLRQALAAQVAAPVRWVATQQRLQADYAVTAVAECGPGQVLSGLGKRSVKALAFTPLVSPDKMRGFLDTIAG